ncbi:MAG: VWA domain-containing protein, partial [Candidatus Zixiibacteriota bacterium]
MQSRLERAVDSAALAGAGALVDGSDAASDMAVEYLVRNPLDSSVVGDNGEDIAALKAQFLAQYSADELEIEPVLWDSSTGSYATGAELPNAVRVEMEYRDLPLFFGRVLGKDVFTVHAEAIATYQPRDIVLVLDLSGSMNDDSELKSIYRLSQAAIEENLFQIWQELGSPTYGTMGFEPVNVSSSDTNEIKQALGLDNVPYPYPSGSWNDFISYVKSDSDIRNAGYKKKYGMLTLINYWLERKPRASQTPDLWMASAQPVTAVKDAVDVFIEFVSIVDTDDRIALAVYDSANGEGQLEIGLTSDFGLVSDTTRHRQAGHYHNMTNIAAGMEVARHELEQNARAGAFKMMVLLTDGNANWYQGGYNTTAARQAVLDEASQAEKSGIPVLTISLGAGADTGLMQDVADTTDGIHFNVPGGQTVEQY